MKIDIRWAVLAAVVVAAAELIAASGTPSTLRVNTDASGNLLVASGGAGTPPFVTTTFANTRLTTDASGNLLVAGGTSGVVGGSCAPNFVTAISTTGVPTCTTAGDAQPTISSQLNFGNRAVVNTVTGNYIGFLSTGAGQMVGFDVATPFLTSGWGTGPTIETKSTDATGRVTLGTAPNATTLTMDNTQGNPRVCFVQNDSTATATKASVAAGVVTFTGTFVAGNVISWICLDHRGT